jgi:hypothetical protein
VIIGRPFKIIREVEFLIYAIIALLFSTMGVSFEIFIKDKYLTGVDISSLDVSIFTFSVATLSALATDYFFDDSMGKSLEVKAALLFWVVSLFLVFLSLLGATGQFFGLVSSILVWLSIKVESEYFTKPKPENVKKLAETEGTNFGGDGL